MYHDSLRVHLIDMPGFDDTHLSDVDVLQMIANWMSLSFQNGIKLSGIIFLHRIMDTRMGGSIQRNLFMFKKLCGENALSSVALATTWWSKIDETAGSSHEQELINKSEWWRGMVEGGSRVFRHTGSHAGESTGSRDSALALIGYILSLHVTVTVDIQDEINNKGQKLEETAAWRELNADLIKEQNIHKAELEAMPVQMAKAMAEHDEVQAKIGKSAAEQERLKKTLKEIHARKEEDFRVFKAEVEAQRGMECLRLTNEQRTLEENFKRQQQELQLEQQRQVARMETARREGREKGDAEILAKMDAQQRVHDETVRQLQKENNTRDRKHEEQISSSKITDLYRISFRCRDSFGQAIKQCFKTSKVFFLWVFMAMVAIFRGWKFRDKRL